MTTNDLLESARRACAQHGQSTVAKLIGKSPAAVSLVLSGKYPGNSEAVLELIEAAYGSSTVQCPVMGDETSLAECLEARARANRPFLATSSQSARLYRICPDCTHKESWRR